MKVKDIKTGQVFNIENTPSYPKLKTDQGYVDIRDNIRNDNGNCDNLDAEVMPLESLAKEYGVTADEIINWIKLGTGITLTKAE